MLRDLLKGRLFGHPVHPMLVHFPTVLFITGVLFDLVGLSGAGGWFHSASGACIGLGLGAGVVAALFGFIDYLKIDEEKDNKIVFNKASWHAVIQFTVMILFGIQFILRYKQAAYFGEPNGIELLLSVLGLLLMLAGNYLGGELVFKHGVGVHREK